MTTSCCFRTLLTVALITSLIACSPTRLRNTHSAEAIDLTETAILEVDSTYDELNTDHLSSELNLDLSVAAVTAIQVSAMNADNQGEAGAGLAGAVVGIAIARAARKSKQQREANTPIVPLKQSLDGTELQEIIVDELQNTVPGSLSKQFAFVESGENARLLIRPEVRFTPMANSLRLRAEVHLYKPGTRDPIYVGEFDYYDTPIASLLNMPPARPAILPPPPGEDTDQSRTDPEQLEHNDRLAAAWQEGDDALFRDRLSRSVRKIIELVRLDMETSKRQLAGGKAIRYENIRGKFYERGTIVDDNGKRLIIRTLRGGLKSVPYDTLLD